MQGHRPKYAPMQDIACERVAFAAAKQINKATKVVTKYETCNLASNCIQLRREDSIRPSRVRPGYREIVVNAHERNISWDKMATISPCMHTSIALTKRIPRIRYDYLEMADLRCLACRTVDLQPSMLHGTRGNS